MIKNWTVGRPGNEASFVVCSLVTKVIGFKGNGTPRYSLVTKVIGFKGNGTPRYQASYREL